MMTLYDLIKSKGLKLDNMNRKFNKQTFYNLCEGKTFPTEQIEEQYKRFFGITSHEFRRIYIASLIDYGKILKEKEMIEKGLILKQEKNG